MSAALIEAVRSGNPEALAALYSEHGALAHREHAHFGYSPSTLMITRFFRCPSHSP